MGWYETDFGLCGDAPADAFGGAMHRIRSELAARGADLPSAQELLGSLLVVLNCDGRREQIFLGELLLEGIRLGCPEPLEMITPGHARSELVPALYDAVELASEAYRASFRRPPSTAELLQYLAVYLDPAYSEPIVSNPGPWALSGAQVVAATRRKPPDRRPCPVAEPVAPSAAVPVTHAKFGSGVVTRDLGDAVEIQFADGVRRLMKRAFLVFGEPGSNHRA